MITFKTGEEIYIRKCIMGLTKELFDQLNFTYLDYEKRISYIQKRLNEIGWNKKSIVIKKIKGNKYYYEQWREGTNTKSVNLGKVSPGAKAEQEKIIIERNNLLEDYEELVRLRDNLKIQVDVLKKELLKEAASLEEYSFEVFWKDEISARVSVKGKRVHVSRYIIHPIRQLFYSDSITRNQLNEILRLRCFDEGRSDKVEKLKAMGLTEYRPIDIIRKTHGVSYNDYLWIRFPGEKLTAKDVLVRDEYVQSRIG